MRLIVILLLLTFTAPAWAEWVKYGENDVWVAYADPATVKKRGKYVRVWDLKDLKQRDGDGALSKRGYVEYDCQEERMRLLSFSAHSERMADGKVLKSFSEIPVVWGYVPPGSAAAALMRILCK